jgi:hypothetical protein
MNIITKKQLSSLIRETVMKQLSEIEANGHSFVYNHLHVGPLRVRFKYIKSSPGTRFDPPTESEIEILGLSFNGKPVREEQVVEAENELLAQEGEQPISVEELIEDIEYSIKNSKPQDVIPR